MNFAPLSLNHPLLSAKILRQVWNHILLILFLMTLDASASAQSQPPQAAPTVNATAGKAKITVTWNAVNNATGYAVYRSDDGGSFSNTLNTTTTSCEVTYMVGNGHTYSFYVRAYNNWGYSPSSNTASATLSLDSPSASAQAGKAKITLTWSGIADADSYQISRSENDGAGFYQIATNVTGTSYVNTSVYNNKTYSYQVRAYNNAGYSPPSAVTSASLALPAPSGLSLSRATNGHVTFSWGAVADADSYYVYKSPDGINGVGLGTVTGTSKIDTSPYSPETFYYVSAQNASGGSPISYMISTLDGNDVQECPATAPVDRPDTAEHGSSAGDPVNLATGRESYAPQPDLSVYNPDGPGVVWQRNYLSNQALKGYGSPGFSAGWVHTYDMSIKGR